MSNILINFVMPKIFEYFGYVFFFYSNEHEPIHVHVIHGACQVVFELIIDSGNLVEIRRRMLKGYEQMSEKNMLEAEKIIDLTLTPIAPNEGRDLG